MNRPVSERPRPRASESDPVAKLRRDTSYRNGWARKQVDERTQVAWRTELSKQPCVGIIGGGLSGLCCAQELARSGIRSVVFDSGRRSVGGRLATRGSIDGSLALGRRGRLEGDEAMKFDHACQFITESDSRFSPIAREWIEEGLIVEWKGPIGRREGGRMMTETHDAKPRYVAPQGMRVLAEQLGSRLERGGMVQIKRPFWIAKMKADDVNGKWRLTNKRGEVGGEFDLIVVAHNGKCANSLVGPAGAPKVATQLMKLRLSAAWVLMVAFESLPKEARSFQGLYASDPVLSFAANNTAKLDLKSSTGMSCWTLISSNEYAQRNKVPQEALNEEVQAKISQEMLEGFKSAIGASDLPRSVFTQCQLWGAALPLNSPLVECIFDSGSRVAVVGDWLLGSTAAHAAVSGIEGARRIVRLARGEKVVDLGLDVDFKPLSPLPIPKLELSPQRVAAAVGSKT